jgi:NADH:ubiquinone oxidoreductase subunit F (NADH-binding)
VTPAILDSDPAANGLAVGHHSSIAPRLVIEGEGREAADAYRRRGGYGGAIRSEALIAAIDASALRGRGGAAFPLAMKLRGLALQSGVKYLIANAEEGEPASIKDRWLLRRRPHLVIDGALRAASAISATHIYIYASDTQAASSVEGALHELGPTPIPISVHRVERAYVAGEETAAVRAINGGPAKPTDKPPRPFQSGVHGCPTLISNAETLANIPFIATHGAQDYTSYGARTGSPGTFLMTISGACVRPGLYEVPMGIPLRDAFENLAGQVGKPRAFLMGGFFAGLVNPRALDLPLDYDRLRAAGTGLGCGAIVAVGQEDCPVSAAADVMAFYARENAHQCGACTKGTQAMSRVVSGLTRRTASGAEVEKLRGW